MRDEQIYRMNERRAQNDVLLYKQIHFLMTRMEAYEKVTARPLAMLRAIFSPPWLKREVDALQLRLLESHDKQVREVAEKAAQKDRITILK
jgi:hypothetical protein